MAIYFHTQTTGFYLDEVHGPRMLSMPDPAWEAPALTAGETEPHDNDELLLHATANAAPVEQIEVPNPDCTLPPQHELIEVSTERYQQLLEAQAAGLMIGADADGAPVAVSPPPVPPQELERRERLWRDRMLEATDSLVARHRDELEAGGDTTLNAEHYAELQRYRLALRGWPEHEQFPQPAARPTAPLWL
ncbi:phage tail assembly chaperone [Pseudomonas cremoricolorata]|uniref:phage tail assembly chaperone n=1 Tax=Pseudomonas cremoricolorata TaxID=157783 RepID=UPI00041827E7|nr:phage tail assembly chaperone [Pseudomonas cremoricolorata]